MKTETGNAKAMPQRGSHPTIEINTASV